MPPFIYFDIIFDFLFIFIPELLLKTMVLKSLDRVDFFVLQTQVLHMSPFTLYLYLKPLYSILGGSTIFDEPLTKNPSLVFFLWNPLYR